MATNSEIAKAAGVSPAVVSRIVNRDETLRVSEETRARVLKVIEERDYAPNAAARSLKSARAGVVALVVHDLTNPVYAEIIAGAQKAAARHGKALLLGEAADLGDGQSQMEDLIGGGGVDGLILQGAGTEMDRALARAARRAMPTVLLQSGDAKTATLVRMDDEEAGRIATRHLLELGHRDIGFLDVSGGLAFSQGRASGWREAMTAAGIEPATDWIGHGGNSFADGAKGIARLLEAAPQLTAVVVGNVVAAVGATAALHDRGCRLPEDFSVIAIHDTDLAAYLRPALSVVRMPLRLLGEEAARLACHEDATTGEVITLAQPPELIVRASTAPPKG